MTRPHPFELAFAPLADELFLPLRDQLSGAAFRDFIRSEAITALLDDAAPLDADDVDPDIRGAWGHLLFLAFRYDAAGRVTHVIDSDLLTTALDQPNEVPPPDAAAYLQLPDKMFWGQVADTAPHEPIDGIFVSPSDRVSLLGAVLGLHTDRQGFGQITAEVTADEWREAPGLTRQPPFSPLMDGGDQMGFRSVQSEAELIHLVRLALHVSAH